PRCSCSGYTANLTGLSGPSFDELFLLFVQCWNFAISTACAGISVMALSPAVRATCSSLSPECRIIACGARSN
ncbi:MAG: hypothetical protein P8176_09450, partial [Gammaproteobacteria bacterium]